MRAAEEGDGREVSEGEGVVEVVEGGVVGIGMFEAVSWRVAKSVGRRPSGMEGG